MEGGSCRSAGTGPPVVEGELEVQGAGNIELLPTAVGVQGADDIAPGVAGSCSGKALPEAAGTGCTVGRRVGLGEEAGLVVQEVGLEVQVEQLEVL